MPWNTTLPRPTMTELDDNPEIQTEQVESPFPAWDKPPTLSNLKQHLEDARSIHSAQVTKIDGWLASRDVTGAAQTKVADGNSKIQPKLIRKQAEWRYPALSEPFLSTSDVFNVKPVSWEDRDAAKQNQMLLNHQFNTKIDKVNFIDEYVRTAVDEGTVIVKVGWVFEEEEYTADEPIVQFRFDQTFGPVIQQVDVLKHTSPSQYDTDISSEVKQAYEMSVQSGMPHRPIVTGRQTITKTRTVRNHPTVEVCDYRNVIIDPTAKGKIENASFVIYSFESSLSDLRKDGRYQNLDKINVTSNNPLSQPDHTSDIGATNFNLSDEPRAKIVVYEYWGTWDIDGTGVVKPIVAAWVGDTIIRMEDNPYPDKEIPFILVQYLPVRRSNHGEPDGALLEDNQKIIGAVTRGMIDLMGKSANGQTGTRKDALDAVNRRRYEKGLDYEYNPGVNPAEAFYMHKYPEIPQSAPLMVQMQQQEAESMTGVKSFNQGVSGNSLGDVAAGVRGALDASSKRETGILRRLAQGIIKVGRKFTAMNAVFLSEEEVVRVTNEQFVKVRRDDLPGNFDLELSISTAEEDDNKARELSFMLQTVGPNEDPEMRRMLLSDIARLRKMPDLAKKIEAYQPQPDPMQQAMAQAQLALIQAQVATENAKAQSLLASAGLHDTKAGTEQAKQAHLNADTDKKNLDYVEQELGVTQERELQKDREKASHAANIEIIKHGLAKKEAASEK